MPGELFGALEMNLAIDLDGRDHDRHCKSHANDVFAALNLPVADPAVASLAYLENYVFIQ